MRLITFNELRDILGGRGRSSIYRDVAAGRLPKPLRIGSRVYWREDVLNQHIEELSKQGADA